MEFVEFSKTMGKILEDFKASVVPFAIAWNRERRECPELAEIVEKLLPSHMAEAYDTLIGVGEGIITPEQALLHPTRMMSVMAWVTATLERVTNELAALEN